MPCLRSTNSHLASRFTILKNDETERCSPSSYFSHWELADTTPPRPREERERPQQREATWCGHASSRKRRIVQISTFFAAASGLYPGSNTTMSSPVRWWRKSAAPAPTAATVDLDDAVIDLTSEAEPSSSLAATSTPSRAGNFVYSSSPGASSDDKVCNHDA